MFKKKVTPAPTIAPTPPAQSTEAERIIARGKRLETLGEEAAMWRSFATGCAPGRCLLEHYNAFYIGRERPPQLNATMDEDSALLWRDFAIRMADDRERRLRDVLGDCK